MKYDISELMHPVLDKNWNIDCIEIVLTQNKEVDPIVYKGKGYLYQIKESTGQDREGLVCFRLFVTNTNYKGEFNIISNNRAGLLLPNEEFYSFKATDWWGRKWTCNRVYPDTSFTSIGTEYNVIVEGKLYEIETVEEAKKCSCSLKMAWAINVNLPATNFTKITTEIDGDIVQTSSTANVSSFETKFGNFKFIAEPNKLISNFYLSREQRPQFYLHLEEALNFILGQRLHWNYMEECVQGSKFIRIRGQRNGEQSILNEPTGGNFFVSKLSTWPLFIKYLEYIVESKADGYHPISMHMNTVYQAAQNSIEAKALALAIAVEGLCNELFKDIVTINTDMTTWIDQLTAHISNWERFSEMQIKSLLYQRIIGLLGQLKNVRTKDILKRLQEIGLITDNYSKTWSKLRNGMAHANHDNTMSTQELLDQCAEVTVLIYLMIFKAIGYEGNYTDYTQRGYPPREFPWKTAQELSTE